MIICKILKKIQEQSFLNFIYGLLKQGIDQNLLVTITISFGIGFFTCLNRTVLLHFSNKIAHFPNPISNIHTVYFQEAKSPNLLPLSSPCRIDVQKINSKTDLTNLKLTESNLVKYDDSVKNVAQQSEPKLLSASDKEQLISIINE